MSWTSEVIRGPLGERIFCPYDNLGNTYWVYRNIMIGDTYINDELLTPDHSQYKWAMENYGDKV